LFTSKDFFRPNLQPDHLDFAGLPVVESEVLYLDLAPPDRRLSAMLILWKSRQTKILETTKRFFLFNLFSIADE
jgi:hypothetical protein